MMTSNSWLRAPHNNIGRCSDCACNASLMSIASEVVAEEEIIPEIMSGPETRILNQIPLQP